MGAAHYTAILAQNSEYSPDRALLDRKFSSEPQSVGYNGGSAGGDLYQKMNSLGLNKGSGPLGLGKGGRLGSDFIDRMVSNTVPFREKISLNTLTKGKNPANYLTPTLKY